MWGGFSLDIFNRLGDMLARPTAQSKELIVLKVLSGPDTSIAHRLAVLCVMNNRLIIRMKHTLLIGCVQPFQ